MGQMAVELRGTDGSLLQLATGKEAKLRIKVPAGSLSKAPATIPMWFFDETVGIWKEEGQSTLNNGWYEGTVKHFTFWNWDFINPSIIIDFKFVDENGNPVSDVYLDIQATVSHTHGSGSPDISGHLVGPVPANEPLVAYIRPLLGSGCTFTNAILTQNLGSFTANDTVCFVIQSSVLQGSQLYTYNINGKLLDCNGQPVTNGYARVSQSNNIFPVDAQGNYQGTVSSCMAIPTLDVVGIDVLAGNTSSVTQVNTSVGTPIVVPPITVCTALPQFMTLITDIGTFSYLEPQCFNRDSLAGGTGLSFQIISNKTTNNAPEVSIGLQFVNGASKIGTFTPAYVEIFRQSTGSIESYLCTNLATCGNFTVTITRWDGSGGYVEGTYTGTLPVSPQSGPPTFGNTFSGAFKAPIW
jgi:hypothetical protein